jgi:hypothetical protein
MHMSSSARLYYAPPLQTDLVQKRPTIVQTPVIRLRSRNRRRVAVATFLSYVALSSHLSAQDLEPRQYSNIPIGLNFVAVGYGVSDGGVTFDPSIQLENATISIDGPALGYARSLALGRFSGKVDAGLAHVCLDGSADYEGERVARNVCGWSDSRVRLSVNFRGAPPLRLGEFTAYRQNLIVGASVQLSLPTGQYDPERLVNIGTNRSAVKLELGMSKLLQRWFLELALAGTIFETNEEFAGRVREQDPILGLQLHAVRNFPRGSWIAFDVTHYSGGQTRTDGVENANRQSNGRVGLTFSLPLGRAQSLKLYASSGVLTRTGTDFNTAGLLWQYRWGGGL